MSMSHFPNDSPVRRRRNDLEAESSSFGHLDDENVWSDPFDISATKNVSVEALRRWRRAVIVLNASRRFRYTLDLKKNKEKKQTLRKIRAHAQVIRAAYDFKNAGEHRNGTSELPTTPNDEFAIEPEKCFSPIVQEKCFSSMGPDNCLNASTELLMSSNTVGKAKYFVSRCLS